MRPRDPHRRGQRAHPSRLNLGLAVLVALGVTGAVVPLVDAQQQPQQQQP